MAKKKQTTEEVKQTGTGLKFLKFLLAILIPLIFLLLMTALFLKLVGLNPVQVGESLLPGHKNQQMQKVSGSTSDIQQLNLEINDQKNTIKQLQNDNNQKSDQIAQLNNQLKQAQNQANQVNAANKNQQAQAKIQVYAQTYRNMDPNKAAAIFDKLSVNQAASYLNMMDDKTKASILENMTPAKAAQLTTLLKANPAQSSSSSSAASGSTTGATSTGTSTSSTTP